MWSRIGRSPLDASNKRMWVFGSMCIKQGCKHAKEPQRGSVPQVFLHESQLERFIECRAGAEGVPFRLVTEAHIGHVVVCVDHFPNGTQTIIFNMMLSNQFDWNHFSPEQLAEAQICIGYGKAYHFERHSQWKEPNSRNPKLQWRFTPANRQALKAANYVVKKKIFSSLSYKII